MTAASPQRHMLRAVQLPGEDYPSTRCDCGNFIVNPEADPANEYLRWAQHTQEPTPPAAELTPDALPEGVSAETADFALIDSLGVVPEGSQPLFAIIIVSTLDSDGDQADELALLGTVTVRDAVGSMEAMKFRLLARAHGLIDADD